MKVSSSNSFSFLFYYFSGQTTLSAAERLGQCEVCAAQPARYSCPKCEVKTCCLQCVQIHKKELECNGIRDRSKFLAIRKMTKMDFMNDYYFLEECTRYVEDRKTDSIKHYTRYNKELPPHLHKLRGAAASRKTKLRFLLLNFTRHKENTTFYNWREKCIYWRIEWVFTNACNAQFADERCSENEPLFELLNKYVHASSQIKGLEYYQSVGAFGLKVLLKSEGIKRCRSRFYALDCAKTLRENLAGKTLVEYPCIYVSYEQQSLAFDIIESGKLNVDFMCTSISIYSHSVDEDIAEETKKYNIELENLRREQLGKNNPKENIVDATDALRVDEDAKKLQEVLKEKRHEERKRKREEFESMPNNFLFTDQKLMDILSSSSEEDN